MSSSASVSVPAVQVRAVSNSEKFAEIWRGREIVVILSVGLLLAGAVLKTISAIGSIATAIAAVSLLYLTVTQGFWKRSAFGASIAVIAAVPFLGVTHSLLCVSGIFVGHKIGEYFAASCGKIK